MVEMCLEHLGREEEQVQNDTLKADHFMECFACSICVYMYLPVIQTCYRLLCSVALATGQ